MVTFTPVAPGDTATRTSRAGAFARVAGTGTVTGASAAKIAARIAADAFAASRVTPADQREHPLAARRIEARSARAHLNAEGLRAREAELSEAISEATREKNRVEAKRARLIAELADLNEERFVRETAEDAARVLASTGQVIEQTVTGEDRAQRMGQLAEEVAFAVTVGKPTGARLLNDALAVADDLPHVWGAFSSGELDQARVSAIVRVTADAPPVARTILDEQLAEVAPTLTPAKLLRVAEDLRNRVDPVSPEARHADAFQRRGAWNEPARNGMMELTIRHSAVELTAAYDRSDALAKQLAIMEKQDHQDRVDALKDAHTGTEEELAAAIAALPLPRGIAQMRADVLVDLISLGEIDTETPEILSATEGDTTPRASTAPPRGVRGQVLVTVPTRILAGLSDDLGPEASAEAILGKEFAELDGYGVLDDETAERVAFGIGSFRALFTDDRGAILNVGRDSYAPPKALRRFTEIRDQHCRFPGCERAAVRCDLDHSVPWDAGGETCHDNLAFLCRTHHTMKGRGDPGTTGPGTTHKGWTLLDNVNGVLEWETLSGRRTTTHPERPSAAPETA
ncbi:HNH endonuclease signature motif containing protein [Leucobacter sp. M11]|uniref:HNH endonuclease signature motif containing protein n=1 Tax=Leucobacter sp. M11 TaxID=2993565 RepID=UPI002D7F667A|nr:DUF222 domain-containing protein [Leucobacter sp. M11]MEB4616628.1 DUF222 domain-containing protein [Leucobacter sp. M11]